jgi:hypothetical protein
MGDDSELTEPAWMVSGDQDAADGSAPGLPVRSGDGPPPHKKRRCRATTYRSSSAEDRRPTQCGALEATPCIDAVDEGVRRSVVDARWQRPTDRTPVTCPVEGCTFNARSVVVMCKHWRSAHDKHCIRDNVINHVSYAQLCRFCGYAYRDAPAHERTCTERSDAGAPAVPPCGAPSDTPSTQPVAAPRQPTDATVVKVPATRLLGGDGCGADRSGISALPDARDNKVYRTRLASKLHAKAAPSPRQTPSQLPTPNPAGLPTAQPGSLMPPPPLPAAVAASEKKHVQPPPPPQTPGASTPSDRLQQQSPSSIAQTPQPAPASIAQTPQPAPASIAQTPQPAPASIAQTPQPAPASTAQPPQPAPASTAQPPQPALASAAQQPQQAPASAARAPQSAPGSTPPTPAPVPAGVPQMPSPILDSGATRKSQPVEPENREATAPCCLPAPGNHAFQAPAPTDQPQPTAWPPARVPAGLAMPAPTQTHTVSKPIPAAAPTRNSPSPAAPDGGVAQIRSLAPARSGRPMVPFPEFPCAPAVDPRAQQRSPSSTTLSVSVTPSTGSHEQPHFLTPRPLIAPAPTTAQQPPQPGGSTSVVHGEQLGRRARQQRAMHDPDDAVHGVTLERLLYAAVLLGEIAMRRATNTVMICDCVLESALTLVERGAPTPRCVVAAASLPQFSRGISVGRVLLASIVIGELCIQMKTAGSAHYGSTLPVGLSSLEVYAKNNNISAGRCTK